MAKAKKKQAVFPENNGPENNRLENAPRIQRREVWVDLPDEYEGFKFLLWVNAPTKLWNSLTDNEGEDQAKTALQQLMLKHNNWLNFDGEPYPSPTGPEFWDDIPTELAACIIVASQAEIQKLPNSIASQRRRSKRG